MKKAISIKELINLSYNRYKSKNAITIYKTEYEKNINYFNYKFDIYSLARALKSKQNNIKNQKVAILSENRYEFLVTYLANIIVKNTVIIIDNTLSKEAIEKIIKKHQINTVFFSEKNKEKIFEIYKLNENNRKKRNLNLISFEPINKFPIVEYEKLINIGRYIENYSIDSEDSAKENCKKKNTIIVNREGIREICEEDLVASTYIIGKNIRLKKKKKMEPLYEINSFYKIIIEILLPIMCGMNLQYDRENNNDINDIKLENIEITRDVKKEAFITYRNNYYKIKDIGEETKVEKLERKRKIWQRDKRIETTNFVLIKSGNEEGSKKATV
ncbi:MAG: AMP-binding protein [Clostridia bacterium]